MKRHRAQSLLAALTIGSLALTAAACGSSSSSNGSNLTTVTVALDWTPNTNHTGLYVAQAKGYFAQHGLKVNIIQPGDSGTDTLVASGKAQFGVGAQESLSQARAQGVPLVSLAAIIQHNTSGFASPVSKNIKRPADYAGKTYGSFGGAVEQPLLDTLVKADGGDPSKIKSVNAGDADFFAATKKDVDFEWIFYGWTGIQAEVQNQPINIQYVKDYNKALDWYTPILETNEKEISQNPSVVKNFMAAVSEGYTYAAKNPSDSANILLAANPDLDATLVQKSQAWLSPRYQDDAARWGEQKSTVWTNFSQWLYDNKVISAKIDSTNAYTNDFLPSS